jgi:uncharacterized protein
MQVTTENKIKLIFKATLFCAVFILFFVIFSFAKNFFPNYLERITHGIIGALAAVLTTILFLKFDKKKFSDIGLSFQRKTIIKFFAGILTGVIIMGSLTTSVLYYTHAKIYINPNSNFLHFLIITLPLILLAFMEELGFRAYPLEILKAKLGIRLSILITSVLFALYHIANGWTVASSFYGPGVWGLVFGLAAIYSKGIAMPTGIHYAANLTTSAFGIANNTVSIWIVEQSDTSTTDYGRIDWTTMLPTLVLLVFAIICIELYMRRKLPLTSGLPQNG